MRRRPRFRRSWRAEAALFAEISRLPADSRTTIRGSAGSRPRYETSSTHIRGYTADCAIGESSHATMAEPMSADMQHCIHSEKVSANERLPQPPQSWKSNVGKHGFRRTGRFIGESANRICAALIWIRTRAATRICDATDRSAYAPTATAIILANTDATNTAEEIAVLL